MKERLLYAIEKMGITPYKIGKETSVSRELIGKYLSGKTDPSVKNITILANYLNVNLNWLLIGEGEMLKDNSEPKEKKSIILADNKEVIQLQKEKADLEKLSSKKDKEIEFLRANIDKLVDLVNKLTDPLNKK